MKSTSGMEDTQGGGVGGSRRTRRMTSRNGKGPRTG